MSQGQGPAKEQWGTRIGVILAVTGSAVGLGNFLRFPGQAASNGGGVFLIPYFISLLILGLPIAWVEWSMGRYGGRHGYNSLPGIFRTFWKSKLAPYVGVLGLVIPVVIYMYYVYLEAWCLGYAIRYLTGDMSLGAEPAQYTQFFNTFTGKAENGAALSLSGGLLGSSVFFLAICFVANFVLIYRGLSKGIEWFCNIAMPALVIFALIVLVRVLTLGTPNPEKPDQNVINGLGYMWNIGANEKGSVLQQLMNPDIWLAAAGQIFFTLSVGFGIIINYASYLKSKDDVALSSMTACAGNEFCEVALGGMIAIPAAFVFLGVAGAKTGGFEMGFQTLPNVFNQMGTFGPVAGFLFFSLLFLAAITSSLSMLQPAIAFLEEGLGLGRKASVSLLGFITAIGCGFVVYFTKDSKALDTLDFWIGTFCLFVLATIEVILFAWVLGMDKGMAELDRGASIRIPRFVRPIIQYVAPIFLVTIFILWVKKNMFEVKDSPIDAIFKDKVVMASVGLILLVTVLFMLLTAQAVKRWQALEAKKNDKEVSA